MEMPHPSQTAYLPASFPSATESFIHYLTRISPAAMGTCCFSSRLSQTNKKNALYFEAASEYLSFDKFFFLFCLCLAHKQIAAVQTLWSEKFPSKCVFLRLPVWRLLLHWNCFTNPLRPLLLSSAMEEDTNTYTPASADRVCWEQISNLININIC